MSRSGRSISCGLAAFFLLVSVSAGQVVRVETGQALDANPRVGGYRYNSPVPLGTNLNSQLYVTGQVSGLGRFRGNVGYFAENQLHLRLPSGGMSDFLRRSVGVQDALSGAAYAPAPYYDPTSTTVKLDGILSGRAAPGTNVPAHTPARTFSPLGQQLYVDALGEYESIAPLMPTGLGTPGGGGVSALAPGGAVTRGGRIGPMPAYAATPTVPEPAELFAVARRKEQLSLARDLYTTYRREAMRDQRVGAGIDATVDAATTPAEAGPDESDRTPGGAVGKTPKKAAGNQDVFLDMLLRLRQRRQQDQPAPATTQPANRSPNRSTPLTPLAPEILKPGTGLVDLSEEAGIILRGLAGASDDAFNQHMTRAERQLRSKRYYDAANLYETAGLVSPRNPLARVGMGVSLLGAGESLSAAYQIERAVRLFPPMIETRVDLSAMLDAKIIEDQLGAIDSRLRDADTDSKRMLTFLATFLYHNSDRKQQATTYAEKLKLSAKDDNLLRAYAEFVLTGHRPDERARPTAGPATTQAATQPATAPK